MSPLVYDLPSKHGRRLMSPPHVPYVEVRRRTDISQSVKDSFDGIIDRWWAAFAIGSLVLITLLVITVVRVVRRLKRQKTKPLAPKSVITGKESRDVKATAPGFGSFLFGSPPHIMITPATASPSKSRFSIETDETLADLADYPKCGIDPELGLGHRQLEYQKNPDGPYHPSHISGRDGEDGMLDQTWSLATPTDNRLNSGADPDKVSGSGDNEPELTEAQLRTLVLQFPPPAYPKTSNPMHQTREKAPPFGLEEEPHDDPYTRYPVRWSAFHRPAVWQRRPGFPGSSTSAADMHTTSAPAIRVSRSKSSPTTSQSYGAVQARADPYVGQTYI